MSKQVRFRRGTTSQHSTFTGAAGEVTVDTDKVIPVVHNGSTVGGFPLLRDDRPRGYTRLEIFTSTGTYTIANKTDLRRIRVTCYGGGGGGSTTEGTGGGGGGIGMRVIEVADLTTNVTVTVGAGGSGGFNGSSGGTTSFGTYISCTGGTGGVGNTGTTIGQGGTASGTNVLILGGQGGTGTNGGGGFGGGRGAANGVRGGGGGSGNGVQGCVIIEEIYGLV
jgi:hypothetical protein